MIFLKSVISRFLVISILSITFLNTFLLTSFADYRVGNPQKVASDSDARPEFDINDSDTYFQGLDDYQAFADTLPSVTNSIVNRNDILVDLQYYDMSGVIHNITRRPSSSNGYFSFGSRPDNFARLRNIDFVLFSSTSTGVIAYSVLPKSGNYQMNFRFSSNTGGYTWKQVQAYSAYGTSNSSVIGSGDNLTFQQFSGDVFFSHSFKIASNFTFFNINFVSDDFQFPFGGYLDIQFVPISSQPEYNTSPVPPSSGDIQQDISNSVGNISSGVDNINNSINSGVDSINGNLEEIIRTISMQLEALWNQMYNLIHLDDNKNRDENTKKITDKLDQTNKNLDTIDTDILDGFDNLEKGNSSNTNSIINNNNQNTSNIINNNNENTDKLANGYDNNSMLENNDKLSGKLDEYEKLEEELLKDTKDNLNNFQFDNPFLSFNAVMSDISYILTAIYNGLGSFNIPIAFSFTLTIAMLCIGWYRFKGGT